MNRKYNNYKINKIHNKLKKPNTNTSSDDDEYEYLMEDFGDKNIYIKDNNIFFYTDVSVDSCLTLSKYITQLTENSLIMSIKMNISPPPIYLHIQSDGGNPIPAFNIIDQIQHNKVPIISIIEGSAASAATLISVVCHERRITKNSLMLIHQMSVSVEGTMERVIDEYISNEKIALAMKKIYQTKTKITDSQIEDILKRDIWWTSLECFEYGLVDIIDNMTKEEINKEIKQNKPKKEEIYKDIKNNKPNK